MIEKKLSGPELEKIAKLSALKLRPDEVPKLIESLSQALSYFQQISNVETAGVQPLITPVEISQSLRLDEVHKEYSAQDLLSNAPQKTGHLFTVPPVV